MNAIVFSALTAVLFSAASDIPDRPEKIVIPPLQFEVPGAKDAKITLKNGIPVFLVADPTDQPLVSVRVYVRGGEYLASKPALAEFMADLMRRGGTQRSSASQLDERLDFLAARLNSGLGEESASLALNLNIQEKDLKEGLQLMRDVLMEPAFAQDRLELVRKEFKQDTERLNDDAARIERYQSDYLTRGEDHYTSRLPTPAVLDSFTREDMQALHGRLIHPKNMVIAVGGRFDRKAVQTMLDDVFGGLKPLAGAQVSPAAPAPDFTMKPAMYACTKSGDNQGRVSLFLPGLRRTDPDWHAVEVMNFIFGGDFTSRLVMKIRMQEGLAYSVRSQFPQGRVFLQTGRVSWQTKNRTVAYSIRLVLEEARKMREELVTDEEFDRAKKALIKAFPAHFGDPVTNVERFADDYFYGMPDDYWQQYRDRVQSLTKNDIQRVAQKYLDPAGMAVLLVGDIKAMESGDPDHPGLLKDATWLPIVKVPLRDPQTLKPLAEK
jgi:predicted Zn-dependent peptidase